MESKIIVRKIPIVLFLIASSLSFFSQNYILNQGLFYELSTNEAMLKNYSIDNNIYNSSSRFYYQITIQDSLNRSKEFIYNGISINNARNDVSIKYIDTIRLVRLAVFDYINVNMLAGLDSNFNGSIFRYDFLNSKRKPIDTLCDYFKRNNKNYKGDCGDEINWLIENKYNVLLNMPQSSFFPSLEYNPRPIFYKDENIKEWKTNVEVNISQKDYQVFNKNKLGLYAHYKKTVVENINTKFGLLKCVVVNANAYLKNGSLFTKSTFYFNDQYGFVKMRFVSMEKSSIELTLVDLDVK